jgi:cellular nucleic acid-binding protein
MVSNPYATPKDVLPTTTICEVCDNREIMTKDWHGHKNSKGHRKNEEAAKAKENQSPGDANGDSSDGWQNTADVTGDVATTGWGDNGSFGSTNASGNGNHGRSGNANGNRKFNGACYGCGEEGHSKRDCPQASARACYGCGQTG